MSSAGWQGLLTMTSPAALFEGLAAVTLFAEDLPASRAFYGEVVGLPLVFEDAHSAVYRFGGTVLNLLRVEQADELVTPAAVGGPDRGARALFTTHVEDVDATAAELTRRGVRLLNGPVDRPWGPRTAAFADPAGNVWEIAGPAA
jgi:catechol 2,3-dioxygenase-like lactoylglutathione lyase family enzyme